MHAPHPITDPRAIFSAWGILLGERLSFVLPIPTGTAIPVDGTDVSIVTFSDFSPIFSPLGVGSPLTGGFFEPSLVHHLSPWLFVSREQRRAGGWRTQTGSKEGDPLYVLVPHCPFLRPGPTRSPSVALCVVDSRIPILTPLFGQFKPGAVPSVASLPPPSTHYEGPEL